jgi:hypothetical protein
MFGGAEMRRQGWTIILLLRSRPHEVSKYRSDAGMLAVSRAKPYLVGGEGSIPVPINRHDGGGRKFTAAMPSSVDRVTSQGSI